MGEPLCVLDTEDNLQDVEDNPQSLGPVLRAIIEGTSAVTGTGFFRSLVRHLASALQVRCAFVAETVGCSPERMKTCAVWAGEDFEDDFEYALAGMPCENVMQRAICFYCETVQKRFPQKKSFVEMGVQTYLGTPMFDSQGNLLGLLAVMHGTSLRRDLDLPGILSIFAARAGAELERHRAVTALQRSNAELRLAYDATIEGWSCALDLRDKETEGHSQRVTEMTLHLARALDIGGEELVHIRRGALLHDIGKMGIPDNILLKPGPLNCEEREVMQRHVDYAFAMLSPVDFLRPALDIPYCHHERWDGTGYPRGLKGEAIPLAARIFAVVDSWDALRSDRPYRPAWPVERVLDHIRSSAGSHFDPCVVEAFLQLDPARFRAPR